MIPYCLGFAFTDHDNFVVLIRKNKPAWQKGLLNGVGGKLEQYEFCNAGMAREFEEETGIKTLGTDWTPFTEMCFKDAGVYCYAIRLPENNQTLPQTTEEQVGLFSIIDVRNHPKVIPNLRGLVPMALEALNNSFDNLIPNILDHR
jgi:8-oxo-dGTP diphosphatase